MLVGNDGRKQLPSWCLVTFQESLVLIESTQISIAKSKDDHTGLFITRKELLICLRSFNEVMQYFEQVSFENLCICELFIALRNVSNLFL